MSTRPLLAAVLSLAVLGCRPAKQSAPTPSTAAVESPAASPAQAWFDVATGSGIDFVVRTGHRDGRFLMPETIGGGGALFDMDGDGDLDAYLVQSRATGASEAERKNKLYRNDGTGHFTDVSQGSGADLSIAGDSADTAPRYGMGVACGDYDNDGDVDLYVTGLGSCVLLRNDGTGHFTDVTAAAGVSARAWATSAAFSDLDRDGDLNLFVLTYVNWVPSAELRCFNPMGEQDYCTPKNYNAPGRDMLFRNNGDGTFSDVSEAAGLGTRLGPGLGLVTGDFDDDGWPDVYVANDQSPNQLWLNRHDLRFEDEALVRGCAVDQDGRAKAGMGVAAIDADDDGDLDLLVGNLKGESDSFYRNDGSYFTDVTLSAGISTASAQFTRFGLGLHDLDDDGLLDLLEVNGRVADDRVRFGDDPYAEPKLLFRGVGPGRFERLVDPHLAAAPARRGRAAAFGDVDNDGGIDVLVVNQEGPAELLLNRVAKRGHWLLFRVVDEHGRDALDATVSGTLGTRRVSRDVRPAASYLASNDARVHFGLGAATRLERVTVRWVDGSLEEFGGFDADRIVKLVRGAGAPAAARPAPGAKP